MTFEQFERTLLEEIDQLEDCLRVYRLTEPTKQYVKDYEPLAKTLNPRGKWGFSVLVRHCDQ
jgi:hypothetical protein